MNNFKGQSVYIQYLDKKTIKKALSNSSKYVQKQSSAAHIMVSKLRDVLNEKGFTLTSNKEKAATIIKVYAIAEYAKDGSDTSTSLRLIMSAKTKKGIYFADTEAESQALSETKEDSLIQAAKKTADIAAEKLLINIVKNYIALINQTLSK